MAIPRSRLFDRTKPVTCHCVSRCVRRIALLEPDARRRALRDRLAQLVRIFAIDVLEWALLTNHFHLVAATHPDLAAMWTDEEVARRWRTLSPDYAWRRQRRIALTLPAQPEEIESARQKPKLVARWRTDLADISVFHKFLKQRLARLINEQDDVTGHCFEGRFKSIVAVNEDAVIAHMVYVALNPVRASMADSLEAYEFASISERVVELKRRIDAGEFRGAVDAARRKVETMALHPAMRCDPGERAKKTKQLGGGRSNPWFRGGSPTAFALGQPGLRRPSSGGIGLIAFLAHADAVGRTKHPEKRGTIAPAAPSPLAALGRVLRTSGRSTRHSTRRSDAAGPAVQVARIRQMIHDVESAMSRGLASPIGNFSGSAAALARVASETGRRFIVAVTEPLSGGGRRIAATTARQANIHRAAESAFCY